MFKKIVVGVDGSSTSDNAVRIACDLADKYHSELYLVHTPQPQTVAFAMGAVAGYHAVTTMPSHEEVVEAANKIVDEATAIAKECGKEIVEARTDQGDPAQKITACAQDVGADLIITGRRGLGSIGSLVQGSTSQQVNHLAKCATLSVI
ncbi:putative universal stress protein [Tateyamaria omphalii]|uniref:universal stress protein n=1 Tax=Tateyamaria omphalii TaxID=299262 RepID=UPI00167B521E|nr:universal stress protein [Tateyamaria omphalii]GGX52093.1 putative universal stress protein [Tateyamaria omphalii]